MLPTSNGPQTATRPLRWGNVVSLTDMCLGHATELPGSALRRGEIKACPPSCLPSYNVYSKPSNMPGTVAFNQNWAPESQRSICFPFFHLTWTTSHTFTADEECHLPHIPITQLQPPPTLPALLHLPIPSQARRLGIQTRGITPCFLNSRRGGFFLFLFCFCQITMIPSHLSN